MTDTILAQGGHLDGWIQGLVVLLVIGGSVLKPVAKALIEYFGPKDPASPPGRARSDGGSVAPMRPPAMPGDSPLSRRPRPGVAGPIATPPLARARPVTPSHPPEQRAGRSPRPPAPPKLRPTAQHPVPAPQAPKPQRHGSRTEDRLGHLKPTASEHLGQVDSVIELRDDQIEQVVEKHLHHLEPDTAPAVSKKAGVPEHKSWHRPTVGALRRAVVLSEVLQPPLALRRPED